MKTLGYYDGEYGEIEDMKIPMSDRVCYFGDGVYDATYSRGHNVFALDEHIDRFFRSAELLDIKLDFSKAYLANLLRDLVSRCDDGNLFVYWQATRGIQLRGHAYDEDMKAKIWVMLKPCEIVDMSKNISVITVKDTRFAHCNIKTLNLIPSVMAAQRAARAGVHESVFVRDGFVTECAHSNIHILSGGRLITHPTDEYILAGVARAHLIAMCKDMGIAVEERPFSVAEMLAADEVIVTSAGSLCLRVESVDGKAVGGKAENTIKALQDALLEQFLSATER